MKKGPPALWNSPAALLPPQRIVALPVIGILLARRTQLWKDRIIFAILPLPLTARGVAHLHNGGRK